MTQPPDPEQEAVFLDRHRKAMPPPEEAFGYYKPVVEGTEQAEPLLLVGTRHGTLGMSLAGWPTVPDGIVYGGWLAEANGYPPRWLLASSEAWRRSYPTDDDALAAANRLRKGDLEKAHDLGDERVREIVSVMALHKNGKGYMAVAEFARTPAGVRWQPLEVFSLEDDEVRLIGGQVVVAMNAVLHPAALGTD